MTTCKPIGRLLSAVAEGEATPREAIRAARHLSDCTACRIRIARERRLARMLERDLEDWPVGEEFAREVMANLPQAAPRRRARRRRGLKLAGLAGLGVLGSVGALAGFTAPVAPSFMSRLPTADPDAIDGGIRALLDLFGFAAVAIGTLARSIPLEVPFVSAGTASVAVALFSALAGVTAVSLLAAYAAVKLRSV